MGAVTFCETATAPSARKAFDALQDEAIRMHGMDGYNGTISTVEGFRTMHVFTKYSETKKRQAEVSKLVDRAFDKAGKRDCYCIDLGCVGYKRKNVKKERSPGNAKYVQKYVLQKEGAWGEWEDVKSASTKKELNGSVQRLLEKGSNCRITKKPVLISGEPPCDTYKLESKMFSKRPANTKDTISIEEMHKYVFAGWAAY